MDKLHALICKGCGGLINRDNLTCRSCGTQYKYDDDGKLITVEQFDRRIIYLNGSVAVPAFLVKDDAQMAMEMTLKEVASEIAKKLLPLIEWQTRFEPHNMEYITHARIGVVDPFDYSHHVKAVHFNTDEFWRNSI